MLGRVTASIRKLMFHKESATTLEYGLIIALISVVCCVALGKLGISLQGVYSTPFQTSGKGGGGQGGGGQGGGGHENN